MVLLSVSIYVLLAGAALWSMKRNKIMAWCIVFFIATLGIASNLIVNVGTFMNERFLFFPTVAVSVFLSYAINKLFHSKNEVFKSLGIGLLNTNGTNPILERLIQNRP